MLYFAYRARGHGATAGRSGSGLERNAVAGRWVGRRPPVRRSAVQKLATPNPICNPNWWERPRRSAPGRPLRATVPFCRLIGVMEQEIGFELRCRSQQSTAGCSEPGTGVMRDSSTIKS
jgi:hypothetical protein